MNQEPGETVNLPDQLRIGFIGAGNMASSLIHGLLATGVSGQQVWSSDPDQKQLDKLVLQAPIHVTSDNQTLVSKVDIVVLAVKPQVMKSVVLPLADQLKDRNVLVISIAAGITCSVLNQWLPDVAVIRCMPNTPALVGQGVTGLYATELVNEQQKTIAGSVLKAVGQVVWVDEERLMDSVTAVSGSGPAYFFLMMEAMYDAAVKLGLTPESARLLVQQTALGAATMVAETGEPADQLRKKVTSPGGTTEQAIAIFEQQNLRSIVEQALQGAHDRSIELSKILGQS
ncbi:MAG: pyrroline-5-carboxylate reductase [Gammaproteobacteria bacterium]|nr:pyrroline-5-carboxylate reductase [Gammaproteobacteria bacterium]